MADVAAAFISGHQAGQAKLAHDQSLEDSKLQQQILKHQMDRLKLDDKLRLRGIQIEQAKMTSGQPLASYGAQDRAPDRVDTMGNAIPGTPQLMPANIPGIPEAGLSDFAMPRQTREEERAAQLQDFLQKLSVTPVDVAPGHQYGMPGQPPLISVPPNPLRPANTPNSQEANFLLDGKSVKGDYIPGQNGQPGHYFYNGQDVTGPRVGVIPTAATSGNEIDLTPEAIADTAMRYHVLGNAALPTRISGAERVKILNENARINKALGQTPALAIQKQLSLKSDASSLTRATTLADASRAAAAKAEPQADLIVELSDKVGRTKFPVVNAALLAGKRQILGDDDATLLLGALTEFTAEYAKIIEGSAASSGGASVESRRKAESLVTDAMSKGTLKKQIDQMKQIMAWSLGGYDAAIEGIKTRMIGAGASTSAPKEILYDLKGNVIH